MRDSARLRGWRASSAPPLWSEKDEAVGAWILLGSAKIVHDEGTRRFVLAAAHGLGEIFNILRRGTRPRWVRLLTAGAFARPSWRRKATWSAVAVLGAALFLPWPYKVSCDCEIQPATRRFVAAPYAGIFETSLVEPGDLVRRDQVLARMDGRDIRLELASLSAEQDRFGKERVVNMAAGKVAAAQIGSLELERLALKRRLLTSREESLNITSPIEGIVVSGDLNGEVWAG